jgi:hypothetical protein
MNNNSTFNSFSTSGSGNFGPRDFLESNSLVSKFAFLLLVIFAFIILLRMGISLLSYLMKPNDSPHIINGMVNARQMLVFPQDPSNNSAVTIYRSVNANQGIEFTWSTWIFIENLQTNQGIYKHIFSKGNNTIEENGMVYPNNAPGLYIAPDINNLVVVMNTFDVINEEITIPDIPLNKWINVIIRCKNTTLDVYINGTISRSVDLVSVPKQNYGNVYVGMNGGFDGYVSNLWYYNYALGTSAIQRIVELGPNTKMIGNNGINDKLFNYLSLRWFFFGSGDGYYQDEI